MMKPQHIALMLVCQLIWGLNFVAAKIGIQYFHPVLFCAIRFSIAALLLLPIVGLPPRRMIWRLLPLSFTMGTMHFSLLNLGMRVVDVATTSITIQLQVPFAAVMAAFFFREHLGWRRIVGMGLAFAGIVLIAGDPRFSGDQFWPLMAVVGAAFCWAAANIQVKALGEVDAVRLNGWIAILAAPQLLVASAILEGNSWQQITSAAWQGWTALLYQAVIVAIFSYWIWYNMMRRYPVNQVMPFTLLLPMIGFICGALILGDAITWRMMVGALATVAGVAIIVLRRPSVLAPSTKTGI
jgi:O-acetylserine/cysteine efflux transporter